MKIYVKKGEEAPRLYTLEEAKVLLSNGQFSETDWGWIEGGTGWLPLTQIPELQSQTQAEQTRKVGFALGIGIFFIPFIFAWFTLRKGHSDVSRALSFGWLFLAFISAVLPQQSLKPPTAATTTTTTTAQQPKTDYSQAIASLRSKVQSLDPNGTIVSSIQTGDREQWAVIVVTTQWHYTPKGARLELTKGFQTAWASYTGNGNARIEIKDQSGNKVGGSTLTGSVYVND